MPYADPIKRKAYLKRYCERNAERARERTAAWRAADPARNAASVEKWAKLRARPRHKLSDEERRKQASAYTAKWRSKNKEHSNAIAARAKKKNRAAATALQAKRKAQQKKAMPRWANPKAIRAAYIRAAAEGKTVDHIVPLQSKIVCGLHCEANLALLTGPENSRKYNLQWPDMP